MQDTRRTEGNQVQLTTVLITQEGDYLDTQKAFEEIAKDKRDNVFAPSTVNQNTNSIGRLMN